MHMNEMKDTKVVYAINEENSVPISEEEHKYACKNGIEALETLFEEKDIDIYNLYRESVIG